MIDSSISTTWAFLHEEQVSPSPPIQIKSKRFIVQLLFNSVHKSASTSLRNWKLRRITRKTWKDACAED
ncbi:hypothetical protein Q3G72_003280 [Acer saccharum]|nr:hypothetical protein Q3G72_003280 [Acer saccharum]